MKGTNRICECRSVVAAYFGERDQRLTEGHPEQDDKGEKTYQATRARGLGAPDAGDVAAKEAIDLCSRQYQDARWLAGRFRHILSSIDHQ